MASKKVKSFIATFSASVAEYRAKYKSEKYSDVKLGEMFRELDSYIAASEKASNQRFVKNMAVTEAESMFARIMTRINKEEVNGYNAAQVRATLRYEANPNKFTKRHNSKVASLRISTGILSPKLEEEVNSEDEDEVNDEVAE